MSPRALHAPRRLLASALMLAASLAASASQADAQIIARSRVLAPRSIAPSRERTVSSDDAVRAMRGDLRALVVAQESFARDGTRAYAASVDRLDDYRPSAAVDVAMLWSTRIGWAARATHAGFPGWSCVIWVGWSSGDSLPATDAERKRFPEGEPACDGDGQSGETAWRAVAPAEMASALGLLATRQAVFVRAHGTYANNLSDLLPEPVYVSLQLTLRATARGWTATATHAELPGARCSVWGGAPDAGIAGAQRRDGRAGDVQCDLGAR